MPDIEISKVKQIAGCRMARLWWSR